jgi:uncharacterized protein (UPF0548 family)
MMMLSKPTAEKARLFVEKEAFLPFTYPSVGATQYDAPVDGFTNDYNTVRLGNGEAIFECAKKAIQAWKMFPGGWAFILPEAPNIQEGAVVAMAARVLGIWWLNSCRIVYVINEDKAFGFAYGTLPGHAECGEELFLVEMDEIGDVWYKLKAFSKPRHWAARLAFPLARRYQKKFVRHSKAAMLHFVQACVDKK